MRPIAVILMFWAAVQAAAVVSAQDFECTGDCGRDGSVQIFELQRAVRISLGSLDLGECRAADGDDDGRVSIDDLISSVSNALHSCSRDTADLAISSAKIQIAGFEGGCMVGRPPLRIYYCIHNHGAIAAGPFQVWRESSQRVIADVDGLPPGERVCLETSGTRLRGRDLVVNRDNAVPEVNLRNNVEPFGAPIPTYPLTCTPVPTTTATPAPPL